MALLLCCHPALLLCCTGASTQIIVIKAYVMQNVIMYTINVIMYTINVKATQVI